MSLLLDGGCSVAKIKQISERILDKMIKDTGITGFNSAQARILIALDINGDIPINKLATSTALGKTTLTSMIDRLENSSFVIRKPDSKDRRKYIISLTDEGRELLSYYNSLSTKFTSTYYKDFSEDDLKIFQSYLNRILDNLTTYESQKP